MATAVHPAHAAHIVEKTLRFADALAVAEAFEPGALMVPRALIELERFGGALGERLATQAWATLDEKVSTHTGRPETPPVSTRRAIADACARKADTI